MNCFVCMYMFKETQKTEMLLLVLYVCKFFSNPSPKWVSKQKAFFTLFGLVWLVWLATFAKCCCLHDSRQKHGMDVDLQ